MCGAARSATSDRGTFCEPVQDGEQEQAQAIHARKAIDSPGVWGIAGTVLGVIAVVLALLAYRRSGPSA